MINHCVGIIPATAHSDMLTLIASRGYVAVGVWKMGMPTNSFDISWFTATIDFVENRLENSLRLLGNNKIACFICLLETEDKNWT